MGTTIVDAEPEPLPIDPSRTAVVMIDMQRDFPGTGRLRRNAGQ